MAAAAVTFCIVNALSIPVLFSSISSSYSQSTVDLDTMSVGTGNGSTSSGRQWEVELASLRAAVAELSGDCRRQRQEHEYVSEGVDRMQSTAIATLERRQEEERTGRQNMEQKLQEEGQRLQRLEQRLSQMEQTVQQVANGSFVLTPFVSDSRPPSACHTTTTDVVITKPREQMVRELQDNCVPLLVQQNVDGSYFFDRTWSEFKVGFNGRNGNHWLGNELLHQLTRDGKYKLRFDLQDKEERYWYWVEYDTFVVHGETNFYSFEAYGFSGNSSHDAFGFMNGMNFTTKDRHNAATYSTFTNPAGYINGGGFWYRSVSGRVGCSLNGNSGISGFYWYRYLRTSRMWLMCQQ